MSGASERANGRASGPVLTSLFLFVSDHSASLAWASEGFSFTEESTSKTLSRDSKAGLPVWRCQLQEALTTAMREERWRRAVEGQVGRIRFSVGEGVSATKKETRVREKINQRNS